jgi:hypothetical protein
MTALTKPQTLRDWLNALDLQTYEPLFISNDISFELLQEITADDLRDIGIGSVGHRRILLSAIAKLNENAESANSLTIRGSQPTHIEPQPKQITSIDY